MPISQHKVATTIALILIGITTIPWVIILVGSFAAEVHPPTIKSIFQGSLAFVIPLGLLIIAVLNARPLSVAYVTTYLTLLISFLFTIPFVIKGYYQGEGIIMLGIPYIALWLGSIIALISSLIQSRS